MLIFILFATPAFARSSDYIPEWGMKDPHQGISIPHESELIHEGVKTITVFTTFMDPGLFYEIVAGGGVFPTLAKLADGTYLKGYAYLASLNDWLDYQLLVVYYATKDDLVGAKHILFNRDAGYAYNLTGSEIIELEEKNGIKRQTNPYSPEKVGKDTEHRRKFFDKYGQTEETVNQFWWKYLEQRGMKPDKTQSCMFELVVGSPEWVKYQEMLKKLMPNVITMNDGSIVMSHLDIDIYRQIATEVPGFSTWDRFADKSSVSASQIALLFTPLWILSTIAVGNDLFMASIDTDWKGFYGRAVTERQQLAPYFRQMSLMHKAVLAKRDMIIQAQAAKIAELEKNHTNKTQKKEGQGL